MAKPQSSEVLYITMALIGLLAVCVFVIAGLVLVVAKRRREAGAFYASALRGILEQHDPSVCLSHGAAA